MTMPRAPRRSSRRRACCRSRNSPRPSSTRCCRGRSRGCSAASCWPKPPRPRAGRSRRCSTTTSSAIPPARRGRRTTRRCGCSPKAPRPPKPRSRPKAPLQWRRGRQPVAQPVALHRRTRPGGGHRRRAGVAHRPLQPRRRPGADAAGGLSGGAHHRAAGELRPPAPECPGRERPLYGDLIGGVDFAYLAKVTRLNALALAALATAPAPPAKVTIEGAVTPDTKLSWAPVPGATGYRVWWRQTTAPAWQHHRDVGADATSLTLQGHRHRHLVLRRLGAGRRTAPPARWSIRALRGRSPPNETARRLCLGRRLA